jgi:hypothetical protein
VLLPPPNLSTCSCSACEPSPFRPSLRTSPAAAHTTATQIQPGRPPSTPTTGPDPTGVRFDQTGQCDGPAAVTEAAASGERGGPRCSDGSGGDRRTRRPRSSFFSACSFVWWLMADLF